ARSEAAARAAPRQRGPRRGHRPPPAPRRRRAVVQQPALAPAAPASPGATPPTRGSTRNERTERPSATRLPRPGRVLANRDLAGHDRLLRLLLLRREAARII